MTRTASSLALLLAVYFAAAAQSDQEKAIVKAFSKTVSEYIPSHFLKEPPAVRVGCGWNKHLYEPSADWAIDVRKTDSLVSPYIGIVQFKVVHSLTECHSNEEEANRDNAFHKDGYSAMHRYTFAYQDDKWVIKSREILKKDGGKPWVCDIGPGECK